MRTLKNMKLYFLLIFSTCCFNLFAQDKKVYAIKAGQEVHDVLSFNDIYQYPSFKAGSVLFLDGRTSTTDLNYNFLNGEMDFINPSGDTLSLADGQTIRSITIDKDTFYFKEGYVQLIAAHKTKKLAVKQQLALATTKKLGVYDQPTYSGAVTYGSYGDGLGVRKLVVREDIELVLRSTYYFGDRQEFHLANKKNIMNLYPKKEKELSAFLNEHKIKFSKEEDLKKLFNFLNELE